MGSQAPPSLGLAQFARLEASAQSNLRHSRAGGNPSSNSVSNPATDRITTTPNPRITLSRRCGLHNRHPDRPIAIPQTTQYICACPRRLEGSRLTSGQHVRAFAHDPTRFSRRPARKATRTRSNGTEQARTTMTVQSLPRLTKTDHPDRPISRKTLAVPVPAAQELFLANHQPSAETAPRPNTESPTNAAKRVRTSANGIEQIRTPRAYQSLPKLTRTDHPDRPISGKTLGIPLRIAGEKTLANHQSASETPALPNNPRAANPDDSAQGGRVA